MSYLRSVFLQPNRKVFDVSALPVAQLAASLGLSTTPKLRFLKRQGKKVKEVILGASGFEDAPKGEGVADDTSAGTQ